MQDKWRITFDELEADVRMELPFGGYVMKSLIRDVYQSKIHVLTLSNGILCWSLVPERGMDIGDIHILDEQVSWKRKKEYRIHPDNVNLWEKHGWEKGFFASVASLGPEVFGTPDQERTVHGTGAYSLADNSGITIYWDEEKVVVTGIVAIKGYTNQRVYVKEVTIESRFGSMTMIRHEAITNQTDKRQPLDDGYHIQLNGRYMSEGGYYVLPVPTRELLLRDSAPKEEDPCRIYGESQKLDPIRCYQYVPRQVEGLNAFVGEELIRCQGQHRKRLTAEMLVNEAQDTAMYLVRDLHLFPRSLLAKRSIEEPMYAIEPCRTRPNSIEQKRIDGELQELEPYGRGENWIIIGGLQDRKSIKDMEACILRAQKEYTNRPI